MSSPMSEIKQRVRRPRKRKQKKQSNFTMRPLKYLARMVATVRGFLRFSTIEVTKGLLEDIQFAFEHKWNVTCVFVGGPGEGKSRGVWRLAKEWTKHTGGKFHYCWDIDQIPDVQPGDWLHIDEWFIPEGQGKMQALQRLKHLFDTGRLLMICISVSTPITPNLPFVTFEATTLAQDFDSRQNLFEIRFPLSGFGMVHIGDAIIPLGEDDETWIQYEKDSRARKKEIWDKKGKKIVAAKFDAEQLAKVVIDWADERKIAVSSKALATTLVRKLATERNWDTNYATEPDIVNWVMVHYVVPNDSDSFIPTVTPGWDGLRDTLFKWLSHQKLQKKTAHYLADWYVSKGLTQTQIGEQYGVTRDTIQKAVFRYKDIFSGHESTLGKMAEAWFAVHTDLYAPVVGTGGKDCADVLLRIDTDQIAVNVKWALSEPEYRRNFDSTPEHTWDLALLAVVNSLQTTIRLYPITGPSTYAHWQKGVPCAPEELASTIEKVVKEMVEK